jgi:hypothetical protein
MKPRIGGLSKQHKDQKERLERKQKLLRKLNKQLAEFEKKSSKANLTVGSLP